MASSVLELTQESIRAEWAPPSSRSFDFLLRCCAKKNGGAPPPVAEWPWLIALAEHHGVVPHLGASLRETRLPSEIMNLIDAAQAANLRRALWFTSELRRVLAAFAAEGIEVLPYKGPVLAALIYGDVTLRSCSDLDFFIRQRHVNRAQGVLREMGYEIALNLTSRERQCCLEQGYEFAFGSSLGSNLIELHWRLASRFYCVDLDLEELFARSRSVNVDGSPVATLSPEDLLVVLAVHHAKHMWSRLSMICDLATVLQIADMDWEAVDRLARSLHVRRTLAVSLTLTERLFETELPHPASQWLARNGDRNAAVLADQFAQQILRGEAIPIDSFAYFRNVLALRERWMDRTRIVQRLTFTPSYGEWDAVRLPDFLFPLYRVVRIGRLARRIRPGARRD